MKLSNMEIFSMYGAIAKLLDNDDDCIEFKKMLIKGKAIISNKATEIQEVIEMQNKSLRKLAVAYCDKDPKTDKPILVDKQYQGLEYGNNKEYDNLFDKINDDRGKMLKEVYDYDFKKIKWDLVPKNINGILLAEIAPLMEEEENNA